MKRPTAGPIFMGAWAGLVVDMLMPARRNHLSIEEAALELLLYSVLGAVVGTLIERVVGQRA